MSNQTKDYDYNLPAERIAKYPLEHRSAARMLVLDRRTGEMEHRHFVDFPRYVEAGDLVVLNNSRVVRARLLSEDQRVEFLFLEEIEPKVWKCLVKPGKRMRLGAEHAVAGVALKVVDILTTGERLIQVSGDIDFQRYGQLPLPPYLKRAHETEDEERYQTVFSRLEGSVAAPTAGLHFTSEVLANVDHTFVTLHVGLGTFLPVKVDRVEEHLMHQERYSIDALAAQQINKARRRLAIGTTTVRVLESQPAGPIQATTGSTALFLYPPYTFQRVEGLLTNFHLPKSTLLMLVSAFAGRERVLKAYQEAIQQGYRFYSYGDCMLIV